MTLRLRVPALLVLTFSLSAAAVAQNSASSGSSGQSSQTTTTTGGGITLHLGPSGKGTTQTVPATPSAATSTVMTSLAEANSLFSHRKLPEAAAQYESIVKATPKVAPAQVGLLRCYLMLEKLDEAKAAAASALSLLPDDWQVVATVADVQFRLGNIPEAERLFLKSASLNPNAAEPYLGLARIYKAESLYRRAYDSLKKAHEVAPNNAPVQLLYFHSLPQPEQIPAIEAYVANPKANPQITRILQQYVAMLKKNASAPVHACKLVSNVRQTETKLNAIERPGTTLGAVGLDVKVNKQEMHLALDTGSTGILLGRAAAEKIGLKKLGYQPIIGVGDSGTQGGFTAVADRIRVGDLEFEDCVVKVTDAATPVTGEDGLIGADVFSSYLVDIDIPGAKLRLSPLPPRPNETAQPAVLETMSHDQGEESSAEAGPSANATSGPTDLPKDAYIAPEMKDWSRVYRFRSLLLIPTLVDRTGPMLFLIDTGAFSNVLSTRAANEVTQVRSDPGMQVRGMSGSVAKVYKAEKAALQFGRYEQQNEDIVTFDLSSASRQTGTEVSGILGFKMLRILQIKIDYRDGLVDFTYDPRRLPKQVRIGG